MRKLVLTASALMLGFAVAACDQGPQQAQEPATPPPPAGSPSPQQGMAPQQEQEAPPSGPAGDQPAGQAPAGEGSGSGQPSGGSQ